jgi:hypothetical protein
LAARVCKTCTRPFAFSFAFVPVRGPRLHLTEHDQTRYVCRLTCCATNVGVRKSAAFPHAQLFALCKPTDYESGGQEFESLRARHLISRDNFIFCVARKSAQTKRRV